MNNIMKKIIKVFKSTCWVNWAFIMMLAGLAFISITTQLSGCGNKSNLVLPSHSSTNPSIATPTKL
nr:hypothetical protein [uncultured Gammaproteobacteria bacterium]